MKKTAAALSALALLALAAAVRLPNLRAGYPYINYVDEGHLLHPVADMVRTGRWEPGWYMYPSLPPIAIAAAARLYDPFRRAGHGGRSLRDDLTPSYAEYDLLSPEILLTGRLMNLLVALGIIALAGRLARRLAGPRAGWTAALLAALAPPLALRGAIAMVDPWASFFVLAALLFSERLRTAERPGWEAFGTGAMAGFTFAAKYPAVLVGLVPLWIVLRGARPWQEKIRCLCAVAGGALLAATVAMPGLVLHPREVLLAIQQQGEVYRGMTSPPLWHQALVRAEWDLSYDHPELGAVFLILALAGLVLALRNPALTRTAQAWTLYATVTLLLFSSYPFHPFRNLLPLVAPACILVAILWDRLRGRLAHPRLARWADAAALLLLTVCFVLPLGEYVRERLQLRDSRVEAVDWLALRLRPTDRVLVVRELQILPSELDRLPGRIVPRPWSEVKKALHRRSPRFLVTGVPPHEGPGALTSTDVEGILQAYEIRAHFGEEPTPPADYWWRGNRESVYVLEWRSAKK